MNRSIVVGAGIVGICTALYLQRAGRQVTLIDIQPPGEGTSSGNAGIISTGSVFPEAMPGILAELPGMLLGRLAPVSIRPGYLPVFSPWLARFLSRATHHKACMASTAIAALSSRALQYFNPLIQQAGAEDLVVRNGMYYVYESAREFARAKELGEFRERSGSVFELLDGDELGCRVPVLAAGLAGAVYIPTAAYTLSPLSLSQSLFNAFAAAGGRFEQARVTGFHLEGGKVVSVLAGEHRATDEVFITAGAFSWDLARQLGSDVPLDTERGYHLSIPDPGIQLESSLLFTGRGLAATPMSQGLRLAGTVEFAGLAAPPDFQRAQVLGEAAKKLLPGLSTAGASEWMGFRPSVPDSVPVISASPSLSNVYFGFGHGHLGLTQSAVTGALLAAMASGEPMPIDEGPYRIDRRWW